MTKSLILVDGYGFVFRAYHSLPPLTRPGDGIPTGAVFGFTNMLLKLLESHKSTHMAVALDSGGKTFRHHMDPNYKANRPPPPPELVVQFPLIRDVVNALDLKVLESDEFEADDLLATYARYAKDAGYEVTIVSSDKDLMQLLPDGIKLYDEMKSKMLTEEDAYAKFGVKPHKLRDVFALIGDNSDNIPGVRCIGPKTAAELIEEFGSLDGIYQHIDQIKQSKRKQMLIEDEANARLSYRLVGLRYDAPLEYGLDDLVVGELNSAKVFDFASAQGFKSIAARFAGKVARTKEISFTPIKHPSELTAYLQHITHGGWLAFLAHNSDIYLSFNEHNLVLSTTKEGSPLFAELEQEETLEQTLKILQTVLCSESVVKITYDAKSLYRKNKEYKNIQDIAIMAYAVETGRGRSTLEALIHDYSANYYNVDSYAVRIVYKHIYTRLVEGRHMSLFWRIDGPMPKVTARMEELGVMIDVEYLQVLSQDFRSKLSALEERIFALTGEQFNIGSPKQLGDVLFNKLKFGKGAKSKTGAYKTSARVLEGLLDEGHEVAGLILQWREYAKLLSTYTEALPRSINPKSKRVHTTFTLTSTSTGRFSSTEPNLQNIPIRTEEGQKIRRAFIARPGHKIVSADYSQIELRLLAHYANIRPLQDAFKHGLDIHALTASQMFGVPIEEVDATLRRKAKTINFGIIYGISSFGLAQRLDISNEHAKAYIESYFKQYPGIKAYMDETVEFARAHGYVLSVFGRKCLIAGLADRNFAMRNFAMRAAINAPLQSSAADIIKKAMASLPEEALRYLMLQVHDELLFEIPEGEVETLTHVIKSTMESVIKLSVPLKVGIASASNWGEAH